MKTRREYVQDRLFKASSDLKIALREINAENPATDAVCFHFQQAVEKILKAWLILNQVKPQKTHNLEILLDACEELDPSFQQLRQAGLLTPYAIDIRYPDDFYFPSQEEMEEAARVVLKVRDFMLVKFTAANIDVTQISDERLKGKDPK